jgi:hypothetical protein
MMWARTADSYCGCDLGCAGDWHDLGCRNDGDSGSNAEDRRSCRSSDRSRLARNNVHIYLLGMSSVLRHLL